MTVSSALSKITYAGNGSTTAFPFSFPIYAESDLELILTAEDGTERVLTSDFSITGAGNPEGGTVTYPVAGTPVPTGQKLTVRRVLALSQPTDLTNQGGFYPEVIETSLDRQVMISQQLAEEVERAVKVPISSDVAAEDYLTEIENNAALAITSATAADQSATSAQQSANTATQKATEADTILANTMRADQAHAVTGNIAFNPTPSESDLSAITLAAQLVTTTLDENITAITMGTFIPGSTVDWFITQGTGSFTVSGFGSEVLEPIPGWPSVPTSQGQKAHWHFMYDGSHWHLTASASQAGV